MSKITEKTKEKPKSKAKERFDNLMESLYEEGFTKVSIHNRLQKSGYDITYSRLVNLERCKNHKECGEVADRLEKIFSIYLAQDSAV